VPDPATLIRVVHAPTTTASDIAGMATLVLDLAGRNDAAALEIVAEAARDLARHVDTIVRTLKLRQPPLALGGGLLLRAVLRKAVMAAVQSEMGPVVQVADPPLGAVILARRQLEGAGRPPAR
jgi:N-acetylglucosamine kinase-like BadF-type ATPase